MHFFGCSIFRAISLVSGLASAMPLASGGKHDNYGLKPFNIDLSKNLPRMLNLIKNTRLPLTLSENPGSSAGITLDTLTTLQSEWITAFDWKKEQASMNKYKHYTANIENLDIHFIHETSSSPNAIPIILNHGWPGSFLEFLPVIKQLTQEGVVTATGKPVAFDVIVPSLPGYAFSSHPPQNWTVTNTARVFNTLMTEVLGYKKYTTHGTDWGSAVAYKLYDNFNSTVGAAHLTFLPFYPLGTVELAAHNITLSPLEEFEEERSVEWQQTGDGYFVEQTTKPDTIGLALYDNPVGQLAWIGEKINAWSDPRAGTCPSVISNNEILRTVSLYYLTQSFLSSVFIYFENPSGFSKNYTKAHTDAPLFYSAFKYNVGFWPPALVKQVGNMVSYHNHEFGGHFAGLDNPPALIEDLREIGGYWKY